MSLQNNRYPVELAGELKRHVIVNVDRRAAVLAYIKTFFLGEDDWQDLFNSSLRYFFAINGNARIATLAHTATIRRMSSGFPSGAN